MRRPIQIIIEGINDDMQNFRDELNLLLDADKDPLEVVRYVCTVHDLSLTELTGAPDDVWDGSGAVPAHLHRDEFLSQVTLLPSIAEVVSCPTALIDLHDPAWADCGGWV